MLCFGVMYWSLLSQRTFLEMCMCVVGTSNRLEAVLEQHQNWVSLRASVMVSCYACIYRYWLLWNHVLRAVTFACRRFVTCSKIFKLPLFWLLAMTFDSSENSLISVGRLGVLTSVLLPKALFSGILFGFGVWGWVLRIFVHFFFFFGNKPEWSCL